MHRVALALHGTAMLYEAAIAAEIFGVDRSDLTASGDWYRLVACTPDGAPHPWLPDSPTSDFEEFARCDTVIVPSTSDPGVKPSAGLLEALRIAHGQGVRIAALCTGAFLVAATGLLDQKAATTHWMHCDALARRFPLVDVRADVLYVDEGQLLTSAGKTAALDLCLHLAWRDFGAVGANGLARRLVTPAHRPGGQAQFLAPPAAPGGGDGLGVALAWAREHLDRPISVADLARRAGLSTRQLARRMHAEVDAGPLTWLQRQRVARAQELLERTDATVDYVAAACGLGTATTLRRLFQRTLGTNPTAYRAMFRR